MTIRRRSGRSCLAGAAMAALAFAVGCSDHRAAGRPPTVAVAWTRHIADDVAMSWLGTPDSDHGRAFVETDSGVAAVEMASGEIAWSTRLHARAAATSALIRVRGPSVFIASFHGISALDRTHGAIRWTFHPDSSAELSHFAVDDSALYIGTRGRELVALSTSTGAVRWRRRIGAEWPHVGFPVSFALAGDTLYVGGVRDVSPTGHIKRGFLAAFDRHSGDSLWYWELPDSTSDTGSSLAIHGRLIMAADGNGQAMSAYDRFEPHRVWRVATDRLSFGPEEAPVVVGDTAFFAGNDRLVYAVDARSGTLFWKTMTHASIRYMTLCGRYILANTFGVAVLDRGTGRLVDHLLEDPSDFPGSGFTVSDDRAVVAGSHSLFGLRCGS